MEEDIITCAVVSGILWLITSWRLCHQWRGGCQSSRPHISSNANGIFSTLHQQQKNSSFGGITKRQLFHLMLWFDWMFQTLAYIYLVLSSDITMEKKSSILSYIGWKVLGQTIFEFLAFSIVTIVWFQTIATARAGVDEQLKKIFVCFPILLLLLWCILSLLSTMEAVILLLLPRERQQRLDYNVVLLAASISRGACWTIHGILLLICGYMLHQRLRRIPMWSRLAQRQKLLVFNRVYSSMFICSLCYLIRGISSLILLFHINYNIDLPLDIQQQHCLWQLPIAIIPSIVLLFSLRSRKDHYQSSGLEGSAAALLPTDPPEKMFLDFQRNISGNCDQSLTQSFDFNNVTVTNHGDDDDIEQALNEGYVSLLDDSLYCHNRNHSDTMIEYQFNTNDNFCSSVNARWNDTTSM